MSWFWSARLSKDKVWDFEEKFKEYAKQTKSKKLMNSIKIANLIKNGLTTYEGTGIHLSIYFNCEWVASLFFFMGDNFFYICLE